MTTDQISSLGPALSRFLQGFACCFVSQPTFGHFLTYCRGLLGDLKRKSVEPIALSAGVAVRTLQEFMADHRWQHDRMRKLIQQRIAQRHGPVPGGRKGHNDLGAIGIIDETSHPKKGDKTPGVQRQYCGATGKVDNCIVTVHLAYTYQQFQTLIDRDLYLPESWAQDRPRCQQASIPDDLTHRPKWRMALTQIRRAIRQGIRFDWLVFDEEYGKVPELLFALDRIGQCYVGEVPSTFRAWAKWPKYQSLRNEYSPSLARNLCRWSDPFVDQTWQEVLIKRQTLEPQIWDIKAAPVYLVRGTGARRRPTDRCYWLIHAWQRQTDKHKYFISNAPQNTPVETLLEVVFSRARVEHLFRIAKTQLGMSHFEGRSYVALMRHLTLCQLMMLFLAERTHQLRGEKPNGDHGTNRQSTQRPMPAMA